MKKEIKITYPTKEKASSIIPISSPSPTLYKIYLPYFAHPLLPLNILTPLYPSLSLSLSLSLTKKTHISIIITKVKTESFAKRKRKRKMKESIRCCISCILPCGALDVIRIVHASGRVEEISHSVSARDIMEAYPKHVLRKPPSSSSFDEFSTAAAAAAESPKSLVLPPNAELQRGKIYFLMPVNSEKAGKPAVGESPARRRRKKRAEESNGELAEDRTRLLMSERYLSEILSEKASTQRDRRRGRVGVWRPHLESIEEINGNDL